MESKTEIWREHPDINIIEVSSFGRVRTLDRIVPRKNGTYPVKGHVLTQQDNGHGYSYVHFNIDGKQVHKYVHRLVAQTFIPNPTNFPEVNHKDCNTKNNNVENLEFCTASYNAKYREKFGISNTESKGHPLFAIDLNTMKVSKFRAQHEASREFGVDNSHICAVINGRYKQAGGFWFVNDDDKAVDLTKQKLREIGKTKLTAADTASTNFVSQVIAE